MDTSLYEKLIGSALKFVSYRPRSRKEVEQFLTNKLKKRNVEDPDTYNRVIGRLIELEYVDDRKFAVWWVTQRSGRRPKGARLIAYELKAKGVDRQTIQEAIGQVRDGVSGELTEESAARKALQKKLEYTVKMPIIEQKKKAYTYLVQRGFSGSIIEKIVDEIGKKE